MSKNNLVIFHINTERSFRGGEIQTLHLIRGLQERGHVNCLFARPGSKILNQARAENLPCFTLPMRGEWDVISSRMLRKFVNLQRPDILHAHTAHACSIALMARWPDKRPPIVFSRRGTFPSKKLLLQMKLKNVDAVLAVSDSVRDQLVETGIPADKVFVAESGTDFSTFDSAPARDVARKELGIPLDAFVIGNVSHFDGTKGQDALIRIFHEFAKDHPNSFLLLAGEGPKKTNYEKLAEQLGCQDRILFTSFRKDVERLYPALDVFFLSSSGGEGWSGALREAMACGIPVIATRQSGTEGQVQSGILVSNDPAEWKQALEKLLFSPETRSALASAANQQVRSFTVDAMVQKTEDCYRSLQNINS